MIKISLFNIEGELRGISKAVSRVFFGVCNPPPPPEYPQKALFFSKFPGGMPSAPPPPPIIGWSTCNPPPPLSLSTGLTSNELYKHKQLSTQCCVMLGQRRRRWTTINFKGTPWDETFSMLSILKIQLI